MPSFAALTPVPADPILGLTELFVADPRAEKVSLASGVYVDETGKTPILEVVREAEGRILLAQTTKVYKPIAGDPAYTTTVRALVLGADHRPSGRGASRRSTLRVAPARCASRRTLPPGSVSDATVWLSTPTWPNRPQVFAAAALATRQYPYLGEDGTLDLDGMLATLEDAAPGDVVCLHACCHNPTGIDPTPDQWRRIADVVARRDLLPLVDFAYQGFGDGLAEDRAGLLTLMDRARELLIASSFSKNFALYDERVGALTLVTADADDAKTLLSHAKQVVRANYSNPPAHGGEIVATVFADPELRARWEGEVHDDARPHRLEPARARRRPPRRRRAGRPRGPVPAARDVLAARAVDGTGPAAPRRVRGLRRRRRPRERRRDHAGEPRAGVSRAGGGDAGAGRRRLTARPGRTFPVTVGAPTSSRY